MNNIPEVKVALLAVSRDCFPRELSERRRARVALECDKKGLPVLECRTVLEGEKDIPAAEAELAALGANALVIYLGNFGPEGPLSLIAQRFNGPVMLCAAAEQMADGLVEGRGDAFCGLLNASYNCGLRNLRVHVPERPVATPPEAAELIAEFIPAARVALGLRRLKIFSFGPRPQDFLACNAPVKPLYDLGLEVMENSELDLYDLFCQAEGNPSLEAIVADMIRELGPGQDNALLNRLARLELALTGFCEKNLGASRYAVFANKCWPSFEKYFGCTPCFVNSRLASRGMPVACEVDIYGALSQYMATAASLAPATLLDINNSVPREMYEKAGEIVSGYSPDDLFMGFHCGNTPSSCLKDFSLKHQLIMHRLMEPGREPDITRGTLEGTIRPGAVTIFRLQGAAGCSLLAYAAQGEVLDMDPQSFGGTGVIAVPQMARFYRHVLIGRRFPHHTAVAFSHVGRALFYALRLLGVEEMLYNHPAGLPYPGENPF